MKSVFKITFVFIIVCVVTTNCLSLGRLYAYYQDVDLSYSDFAPKYKGKDV